MGTGSGAVALALKDERPDLLVSGLDVDRDALAVARRNGKRLGLPVVEFVCADLLDGDRYDAVLANLPYVRVGEELAPEIALYEPRAAVYGGGNDGLSVIRRLVAELASHSRVKFVALEVGVDQAETAAGIVGRAGFDVVEKHRDLAGRDRVVVGRR